MVSHIHFTQLYVTRLYSHIRAFIYLSKDTGCTKFVNDIVNDNHLFLQQNFYFDPTTTILLK